jgi:alpha-1,2-mannosyltransferase
MLAVPLSFLPYLAGWFVWTVATGALFALSLRLILPFSLAVPIALAAPASFWCAGIGQNGFLSAAMMAATFALLDRRPWLAGICLGGLSFKPQFGVLLPLFLILERCWQTFLGATLTVAMLAVGSVAVFGANAWEAFAASLPESANIILLTGGSPMSKFQSIYAIAYQMTGSTKIALLAHFALCIAILLVAISLWARPAPLAVKAASVIATAFLFTPYAFIYDSVMLSASVAFLVRDGLDRGFLPWDKPLLCIPWMLPALVLILGSKTAPFACLLLLLLAIRRANWLPGAGIAYC